MGSKSDGTSRKPNAARNVAVENLSEPGQSAYELLDFGEGRKLERFAGLIVDRPSPAAIGRQRRYSDFWEKAGLVYRDYPSAAWSAEKPVEEWRFCWKTLVMELRLSPYGHVGLFPEQIANWKWFESIGGCIATSRRPLKALNLFGYTGGSTLALAATGFHVTHVDASRPAVNWARKNAQLSSLESASIRWIIDDVRDFVKREIRRKESYDAIVMDPPAYGHGAKGKSWELTRDLDKLIADCLLLLGPKPTALLLTGHSPIESIDKGPIAGASWDQLKSCFSQLTKHRVTLADRNRRKLDFGYAYRFWN